MATTTVRVTAESHHRLARLAAQSGCTIQEIVAAAIEADETEWMFTRAEAAYAALAVDPAALADQAAEVAVWDATLADGLADEEP
jgi:hypothetical protein